MNRKTLRNLAFILHRYIGLGVGVLLIIAGLTGSLLVFSPEIDEYLLTREIGHIIPSGQQVSIESVVDTVKAAYKVPELKVQTIYTPKKPDAPYQLRLETPQGETTAVYVNPYTGAIMGSSVSDRTFTTFTLELHEQLLAGETGTQIMGVTALLLFILSITGIILWPGWKRLISGFKVKWKNAHPKRVNFDIHKVAGIITAVFLAITGFTGFYLNFRGFVRPIIYAVTFTPPNPPKPISQPIAGSKAPSLTQLLQKADAALPGAVTTAIYLPETPEATLLVRKKYPQEEATLGRSSVSLDQYTGEIVQLKDALKKSLGDKVLDSFVPLHFGTFGGLPTRILYIFVGLAPLILFITGFVMWWYRYQAKTVVSRTIDISQSGQN